MKPLSRILLYQLLLCFAVGAVGAQYEELPDSRLKQIEDTLRYGVDAAIKDAIETIIRIDTTRFTEAILQRVTTSNNDEVILETLRYFRAYELPDGIPFALKTLENFNERSVRVVQHALFYLGDFSEQLIAERRGDEIVDALNNIILSDRTGIVLAALELLPDFYSEADISYAEAKLIMEELEAEEEIQKSRFDDAGDTLLLDELPPDTNGTDNADGTADGTAGEGGTADGTTDGLAGDGEGAEDSFGIAEQPRVLPYSVSLKEYYDTTRVQVIRGELLRTFAKIQAYTMIDFVIEHALDAKISTPLRVSAVQALGLYNVYPDPALQEAVAALFEELRKAQVPALRSAVFKALKDMDTVPILDQQTLSDRLLGGLRDDDELVRLATLDAISSKLANTPTLFSTYDFFPYIIENDPSVDLRRKALRLYVTLAPQGEGRAYLVEAIRETDSLNSKTKPFLEIAFDEMDNLQTLEAVVELCKSQIDRNISFLLRTVAELAAQHKNSDFDRLVEVLIESQDSEVIYHTLNIISKNRLRSFASYVTAVSRDRTKSFKVRLHARTVQELLQRE